MPYSDPDQMFSQAGAWVKEQDLARPGDRVVVMTGVPLGTPGTTNLLKVIELSNL